MSLNRKLSRYESLGFGLIIFGAPLAVYSHYILLNVPFISLGLACIVLGVTLLMVPENSVPEYSVRAMVEGATVNIEALLEEFDVDEKATYLPPREGRVYAFTPLHKTLDKTLEEFEKASLRVLTEVSGSPGLFIFPPGSEIVRLALLSEEYELEGALNYILVDFVETVKSVKAILDDNRVVIELNTPSMVTDLPRFNRVFGSIPTSLAGCIIASVLRRPVVFDKEEVDDKRIRSIFRLS